MTTGAPTRQFAGRPLREDMAGAAGYAFPPIGDATRMLSVGRINFTIIAERDDRRRDTPYRRIYTGVPSGAQRYSAAASSVLATMHPNDAG